MNHAFKDFPKGARVRDTWFADWGLGVVVRRAKTKLYVQFANVKDVMKWDAPHVRGFLRRVK